MLRITGSGACGTFLSDDVLRCFCCENDDGGSLNGHVGYDFGICFASAIVDARGNDDVGHGSGNVICETKRMGV